MIFQKLTFTVVFLVTVFVFIVAFGEYYNKKTAPSQPIAYNHKKHLAFNIECSACHIGAKEGEKVSIPNVKMCSLCHIPGKKTIKTPSKLEYYIKNKKEIPWKQIYKVPNHVKFSHRMHTSIAKLSCKECHSDMKTVEKPVTRQAIPVKMKRCVSCHRKKKVTTDCLSCHR